jgi:IMP dehydrogenase
VDSQKELKYTFDDFLLVPSKPDEDIREDPNVTRTTFFDRTLAVPIVSSPMDTITGVGMMLIMERAGGLGVHHRYCDWDTLEIANTAPGGIAVSPSMDIDKITKLAHANPRTFFVVDVAHGHSQKVLDFCNDLIANGVYKIVSGNVATPHAVYDYRKIGVDYIRVGIGSGSRCSTRLVTGFGYPQASAVSEIYEEVNHEVCIISDGGCKNTGDAVKAFACGASIVMSGYLFAGCAECPEVRDEKGNAVYRGMASKEALETRKKDFFIEGESLPVESKGSAADVVKKIQEAIIYACYYGGVTRYRNLTSVDKIFITQNGFAEGTVRK